VISLPVQGQVGPLLKYLRILKRPPPVARVWEAPPIQGDTLRQGRASVEQQLGRALTEEEWHVLTSRPQLPTSSGSDWPSISSGQGLSQPQLQQIKEAAEIAAWSPAGVEASLEHQAHRQLQEEIQRFWSLQSGAAARLPAYTAVTIRIDAAGLSKGEVHELVAAMNARLDPSAAPGGARIQLQEVDLVNARITFVDAKHGVQYVIGFKPLKALVGVAIVIAASKVAYELAAEKEAAAAEAPDCSTTASIRDAAGQFTECGLLTLALGSVDAALFSKRVSDYKAEFSLSVRGE